MLGKQTAIFSMAVLLGFLSNLAFANYDNIVFNEFKFRLDSLVQDFALWASSKSRNPKKLIQIKKSLKKERLLLEELLMKAYRKNHQIFGDFDAYLNNDMELVEIDQSKQMRYGFTSQTNRGLTTVNDFLRVLDGHILLELLLNNPDVRFFKHITNEDLKILKSTGLTASAYSGQFSLKDNLLESDQTYLQNIVFVSDNKKISFQELISQKKEDVKFIPGFSLGPILAQFLSDTNSCHNLVKDIVF